MRGLTVPHQATLLTEVALVWLEALSNFWHNLAWSCGDFRSPSTPFECCYSHCAAPWETMTGRNLSLALEKFRSRQTTLQTENVAAAEKQAAKPVNRSRSIKAKPPSKDAKRSEEQKPAKKSVRETLAGSASRVIPKAQLQASTDVAESVPINKQTKDVLDCLFNAGQPLTAEEIQEKTRFSVGVGTPLFAALQNNGKVEYRNGLFHYKSQHSIKSKNDLLQFIRRAPDGTHVTEIKDSYKTVLDDVKALKDEGKIYCIFSIETLNDVLYPVDERLSIHVDADLVSFFLETQLPASVPDLQSALQKAGLRSVSANLNRKRAVLIPEHKERKKPKPSRNAKRTNYHLPGLFTDPQPSQIE